MSLPVNIDPSTPAGSDSPALGDDQIRALKTDLLDLLGVPSTTNIAAAGSVYSATGLTAVVFQNLGGDPATAGHLSRNSTLLKFHDGTAARTLYSASGTDVAVADGGTGLSSGTSGGVLAFTDATTLTSSAALAANQLVLGGGAGAVPATLGSLGTTTTVLHGNAAGAPTFGAVSLTTDVTGTLPAANGGTGGTSGAVTGMGTTDQVAYFSSSTEVGGVPQLTRSVATLRLAGFGTGAYGQYIARAARGSSGAETAVQSGDVTGTIQFAGYNGSDYIPSATVWGQATENHSGSGAGASLNFVSCPNGSTTPTTRVRISQDGTVLMTSLAGTGTRYVTTDTTGVLSASATPIPVAAGGTGLTSGTSGGVLAYTASGTLGSSGLLLGDWLVLGGGAGAPPYVSATATFSQSSLTFGSPKIIVFTDNGGSSANAGYLTRNGNFLEYCDNAGVRKVGGQLHMQAGAVGNVGGGADTLHTFTIPASAFSTSKCLIIEGFGLFGANGNTKTVRFVFGSNSYLVNLGNSTPGSGGALPWSTHVEVFHVGTNSQYLAYRFWLGQTLADLNTFAVTETTASAITVSWTGESGGSATNDCLQYTSVAYFTS